MLLDRGALVQEGSVYRPVGTIDSLEVPETLHALIAARLDGLPSDERRLLQDGSVLGKTFTRAGLAALSGDAEAELDPLLSSLVRKEVMSLQSDPRSPEHGQYGFLQDLVRHVAYETLSKRERKVRHLAAAEHLSTSLTEEEVAEVVASHLVEAYELAPDAEDALEIRERARAALVSAGERAGSLGAAGEAQRYFERAGALTDEPLEQATLADRAGQMAWRGAKAEEARQLLERAETDYKTLEQTRAAARVSARLGEIDFAEGHPRQAVERVESALEALSSGEGDADTALLAAELGRFLALSGEHARALAQIEYALRLAETLNLPETLAQALSTKAIVLLRVDRLFEAGVLLDAAIELADANDLHTVSLRAHNNLGVVLEASDRFTECATSIGRAIELARRVGNRGWESSLVGGAIVTLVLLGRWDEALARAAEAEEIATTSFANRLLLEIVPVYSERGQLQRARELFELYGAGDSEDHQVVIGRDIAEARLLLSEGRLDEALVAAERAALAARELGTTSLWFKLALGAALETALALGDTVKARQFLSILDSLRPGELTPLLKAQQARFRARLATLDNDADPEPEFAHAEQLFRALGTQPLLATTLLEHSQWLLGRGHTEQAEPLREEARAIFEQLEAAPWLARTAQESQTGPGRTPEVVTGRS
jgi:tetratricopeptide (TPR) repeat protein